MKEISDSEGPTIIKNVVQSKWRELKHFLQFIILQRNMKIKLILNKILGKWSLGSPGPGATLGLLLAVHTTACKPGIHQELIVNLHTYH